MASRRAWLASRSFLNWAPLPRVDAGSDASLALHSGHWLAKPGLPGFSSNSSPQRLQVLMGNATASLPGDNYISRGGVTSTAPDRSRKLAWQRLVILGGALGRE